MEVHNQSDQTDKVQAEPLATEDEEVTAKKVESEEVINCTEVHNQSNQTEKVTAQPPAPEDEEVTAKKVESGKAINCTDGHKQSNQTEKVPAPSPAPEDEDAAAKKVESGKVINCTDGNKQSDLTEIVPAQAPAPESTITEQTTTEECPEVKLKASNNRLREGTTPDGEESFSSFRPQLCKKRLSKVTDRYSPPYLKKNRHLQINPRKRLYNRN